MAELELPAALPEVATAEALPELAPGERFRMEQREAEHESRNGYLPRVIFEGNAKVPPLVRLPSGTSYAVRGHESKSSVTLVRVGRLPRSKKERRRLRELAKAQAAGSQPEVQR